jgi:hypothetical protein
MKTSVFLILVASLFFLTEVEAAVCPTCGGAGGKWVVLSGFNTQRQWMVCPTCGGTGRVADVSPSVPSSSSLNPAQQQMLNSVGQAGYQLGQWLFSPDPQQQQAVAINQQGVEAFQRGDYQTAINCYSQAVKLAPDDKQIQANLYDAGAENAYHRAALAADRKDVPAVLAEMREAIEYFEKSLGYISNKSVRQRLADARRELSQLEDTLRRNKIAADLNGVLKLSGTPDPGRLRSSSTTESTGTDNPLGLKLSGLRQLASTANDSSSFDGSPGSTLSTPTATATDLRPQGTPFFGTGGGPKYSAPEPTGDPKVVDLRDTKTTVVDPAVVKGFQPQGGAGVQQRAPDKLPRSNPTTQQTLALANPPDAPNPLGLKLGDSPPANDTRIVDLRGTTSTTVDMSQLHEQQTYTPSNLPAPMSASRTPKYDSAKIQAEIAGIRKSLAILDAVHNGNASQREEWLKASEEATRDAIEDGANLTVDFLAERLKDHANLVEKELQQKNDLIINEKDQDLKKTLQDEFKQLANHKEQLERASEDLDLAHRGVDELSTIDKDLDEAGSKELLDKSRQLSKTLEEAWDACDQADVLPKGASLAKSYVDAAYEITVQATSVVRMKSVNNNEAEYLNAVTQLGKKMKVLVDLQKANTQDTASGGQ